MSPSQQNGWLLQVSPSQQNGWLLKVEHTLCVTDKVNRYLSKKIKTKYKASNCCKIEAVIQRYFVKKVLLNILQDSEENPSCVRISFLIKLQYEKILWHTCFRNIAKLFRTPFLYKKYLRWLPVVKLEPHLWNYQNFSSSYFWLPLHCDVIVVKRDIHRKIFVVVSIHIAIKTSKHLN